MQDFECRRDVVSGCSGASVVYVLAWTRTSDHITIIIVVDIRDSSCGGRGVGDCCVTGHLSSADHPLHSY